EHVDKKSRKSRGVGGDGRE
ncbi:hypothetical protein CCACVL1_06915, partial [Corchorus capsularis]